MEQVALKQISFGGISLQIPEVWKTITETYTEPDGRECTMIEISAEEGDPRSIIISYGPMPEGSDALMEAGGTYEEIISEIGPEPEEDPICEYGFLGTTGYGFEVPTEDGLACNFICSSILFNPILFLKLIRLLTILSQIKVIATAYLFAGDFVNHDEQVVALFVSPSNNPSISSLRSPTTSINPCGVPSK